MNDKCAQILPRFPGHNLSLLWNSEMVNGRCRFVPFVDIKPLGAAFLLLCVESFYLSLTSVIRLSFSRSEYFLKWPIHFNDSISNCMLEMKTKLNKKKQWTRFKLANNIVHPNSLVCQKKSFYLFIFMSVSGPTNCYFSICRIDFFVFLRRKYPELRAMRTQSHSFPNSGRAHG